MEKNNGSIIMIVKHHVRNKAINAMLIIIMFSIVKYTLNNIQYNMLLYIDINIYIYIYKYTYIHYIHRTHSAHRTHTVHRTVYSVYGVHCTLYSVQFSTDMNAILKYCSMLIELRYQEFILLNCLLNLKSVIE